MEDSTVGWSPILTEMPEFTIFTDELTYFADKIAELPYGVLALIAMALKDIKSGEEDEIDPTDYGLYEKMYYFIAGCLLRKEEKELLVKEKDIDSLEEILGLLTTKISLVEGYYAGILGAKFVDNAWMYGMSMEQAEKVLSIFSKGIEEGLNNP